MEQPIRVLHVEDEPDFAEVTASFLEREDERIRVESEARVDDALETLAESEFDCVLSDYDMPGRDGIAFLEAVRAEYPDLPFILYTGKGSEEIASEAISAGVTDYLQKKGGTDQFAVLANRITNAASSYRAKQSLDERNRELRRYERMVNSMLESACIYDEEGRFEVVNEYLADWYGKPPEELEGEESNLVPMVREQSEGDPFQELLDGEREEVTGRVEGEFPGYGHAVLDFRFASLRVDDTVEGVVGVTREVTARQQKTRRLETLIRNLPGIVYRCHNDPDWPMEFVRGECETLTGYPAEAIESGDAAWGGDIIHPTDREYVWETVQDAIDADRPFEMTYRILTDEGETKWVWERGRLVSDPAAEDQLIEGFITDVSDRKQREEDLERTNALLSTLFDTLPQGVIAEDDSRDVLAVNQRLLDLFEVDAVPDDVVGRDCRDFALEVSDRVEDPQFADHIDDLVEAREPVDHQEVALADGRTFERSYRPIELPAGEGHLWMYRDVTGRKERQRALETVFDQMADAVFVHPVDGPFTFVNQAAVERYGYDEAELLEMYPSDLNGVDPAEKTGDRIEQVSEEGQLVFETEHRTASGETIPAEINATSVTFRGEPAILSIARDVTERREAERELRETKERLDLAVEGAGLGVWDWNVQTDEVEFNEQWATMLGYSLDDIEPHVEAWRNRLHPEDRDRTEAKLQAHLRGETDYYESEHRLRTADGEWRWVRDIGRVVERTDDGDPVRAVGIYVDIDEFKEREQELERQNTRLDQFASVVSHDLRNPLNVAQGRLELLSDDVENEHLAPLGDALARMDRIIEDVLVLAREGEDIGSTEPKDLGAAAREAWGMVAATEAAELSLTSDATDATIEADETRLNQLLENLFRNAVEHGSTSPRSHEDAVDHATPESDDEAVTVTVGPLEDGFYVGDDGPGIPEAEREEIFETGYSTSEEGTGFGLSIVQRIAEAHGWSVAVTDSEDGGARFEVRGVDRE